MTRGWAAAPLIGLVALLTACGGSGGASSGSGSTPIATPTPSPTPSAAATCSLRSRQDWAAAQLREWYLFPETLPATLDPAPYSSVEDYVDALTATARAQGRDRFFTYLTSIAEEDAFFDSGETAAFGVRLQYDAAARRVFVADAYEGAPALAAGIDRGTEIIAIGTTTANLRTIDAIIAAEGEAGVGNALGPSVAGLARVLQVSDANGTRTLTLAKADFAIPPISPRYGTRIIDSGAQRIGYVNLRTFISTADPALRTAFANFRAQGVTQIIVDLRYNGGGLISTSELMGDLLGGNRIASDVFAYTTYRPSKSQFDETRNFRPQPESVPAMRIAFIATGETASASEIVINGFTPYMRSQTALIGDDTFGKPVGQIAEDRNECDDRLRITALAVQNAARQGDYYNGLAATIGNSCRAGDTLTAAMGDPGEASTAAAIGFLTGQSCTPIAANPGGAVSAKRSAPGVEPATLAMVMPQRPDPMQRQVPGSF